MTPLGVQVVEHDVDWLTEQGFGGVLAVGGGAAAPPRLIRASWRPRGARPGVHAVLVGKGITFDTGGIQRKPGSSMSTMYTDMAGGAAVLGALHAVAAARLPVRVTALVPAAENSISGSAYRPGDVVRHYGGRTSEIGNTDAEGRLVLADAMAYAVARLRPSHLVDIATLTGAMKVALGTLTGGLLPTDDDLAAALLAAGTDTGEPLWRLPLRGGLRAHARLPGRRRDEHAGQSGRHHRRAVPAALRGVRAVGAPRRRRSGSLREGRRGPPARRHRVRRAAARPLGGVAGVSELVLPFVVRIERDARPGRTDALEAAARAVLLLLTAERPEWADALVAWDGQRIRKVVRRARGADWRRALSVDGLDVRQGSAQLRVYPPVPVDGWPQELARLQVGGTNLEDAEPPGPPAAGMPVVLLSPHAPMTTGKAMAQAAHAAQLGRRALGPGERQRWQDAGFALAVRDATAAQWATALADRAEVVHDGGFTEVEPGTATAAFVRAVNPGT